MTFFRGGSHIAFCVIIKLIPKEVVSCQAQKLPYTQCVINHLYQGNCIRFVRRMTLNQRPKRETVELLLHTLLICLIRGLTELH